MKFLSSLGFKSLFLGIGIALAGCSRSGAEKTEDAPLPVKVSHPLEREVTDFSDQTGRVAAIDSVQVRARVFGYIDRFNFKEGALVEKDAVLFEIDPRTYKASLTQAEGNLASAEARAGRLQADYKRAVELKKKESISQQEYDKILGDLRDAKASVLAQTGIVKQAELDLGFTEVMAPVKGRVGRALVTAGNLVQSGQNGGGTLLTTIVSVDPMYVYFDVDERTVLRVRRLIGEGKAKSARDVPDLPVYLGLANEEGFPHKGYLDFVDNQVNPQTGTLRVRGVFPNPEPLEPLVEALLGSLAEVVRGLMPETLAPGYFARIRVPIGFPRKAILISERAIDSDQGQKIVYVVDQSNKIVVRPIRLGDSHDGYRSVEEGLKASDRVLVTGLQQVRAGQIVEPTVVTMPRSPRRDQKPKSQK
jgi:RND family efflux transporter MFP subunit